MGTAVYMDYHAGHSELSRSLRESFVSADGLQLLEQSSDSLVSQDAENKKLALDQVCTGILYSVMNELSTLLVCYIGEHFLILGNLGTGTCICISIMDPNPK
jgi:hypothetical protein